VPVEVIVNFSKIKQLTDNTALLVEAVQDSSVRPLLGDANCLLYSWC
jgi:hypothetical protein